jgi:hypothetical protein
MGNRDSLSTEEINGMKQHFSNNTLVWFDLEGIGFDDGMGYTVKISAPNRVEDRLLSNKPSGGLRLSSKQNDRYSVRNEPRATSRSSQRRGSSRTGSRLQKYPIRHPSQDSKERIEIVERRSVEIRESFHGNPDTGTEEIRVWRSGSERGEEQDPSRSVSENSKRRAEGSRSPPVSNRLQHATAEKPEVTYRIIQPPNAALPESGLGRMSSTRSHHGRLSPSGSPLRRPINPLNSSQVWAAPRSPRERGSVTSSDVDPDMSFILEIANMRDMLNWSPVEGSLRAEDGSTMERVLENDEIV